MARLRKAAGYTLAEPAEAIGVSRRMIAYYETEAEHPPAAMLARLALTLRVSTDELLGLEEGKKLNSRTPSRRVLRRLKKIEKLPKRDQDELLRTIDALLAKSA